MVLIILDEIKTIFRILVFILIFPICLCLAFRASAIRYS
jgi:hypothetical protein